MMATPPPYKESPVWQQSMQLAFDVYDYTATLPAVERLNLSLQLQQAATSVPSAIAAGSQSGSRANFKSACEQAAASLAQIETILIIASQQYPDINSQTVFNQLGTANRLVSSLLQRLSAPHSSSKSI